MFVLESWMFNIYLSMFITCLVFIKQDLITLGTRAIGVKVFSVFFLLSLSVKELSMSWIVRNRSFSSFLLIIKISFFCTAKRNNCD